MNRRPRILFVDDEEPILEMLQRMMESSSGEWETVYARSVDEALACLSQGSVDTIVTDVRMPVKDGFDLLHSVRSDPNMVHIPVLILTGDGQRHLKRKALDAGATDLLSKPVDRNDLVARLRSALKIKRYEDELSERVDILDEAVRMRTCELERSQREVIQRLAKACEFRDDQTGNHVLRVARYARVTAEALGLDQDEASLISLVSPLHDVGKIGVPDKILLKPGPLSDDERRQMQQHCLFGREILAAAPRAWHAWFSDTEEETSGDIENRGNPLLATGARIAYSHHERYDGTGYPEGLQGKDIPVEARIVAVADVFDALTTTRPYKPPFHFQTATRMIEESAGTHLDPEVVEAFLDSQISLCDIYTKLVPKDERVKARERTHA